MEQPENYWISLESRPWTSIRDFAQQLIDAAEIHEEVLGVFSSVHISVNASDNPTVDSVLESFREAHMENLTQRQESPEWTEYREEVLAKREHNIKKANELISQLNDLDFRDHEAVLDWLCSFEKVATNEELSLIKPTFKENGYTPWMNTEKLFDWENSKEHAEWIIWQYLLSWYSVVHRFTDKWKEKFAKWV